ncbi:hypothetical protein KIN20_001235 [Parelaphostrongylus tenuis]|uniref:Uncharacterized protein n=1 Tax=Parelaphostrongylus tenuis TaxID=148309 RepID=A0AAD5MLW2_PARTN|nr:hypothetical protein KIN20_001235 [Parelaphostrongylus tenuis]
MIALVVISSTAMGCGVMPPGQASTRTFNVSGFTLPVAMVYSAAPDVRARIPGIATDMGGAQGFVLRLVMQTVFDVLERQARSALLPDPVISAILSQLEVRVAYEPLECQMVISPEQMPEIIKKYCIIADNTVTGICTGVQRDGKCNVADNKVTIAAVPSSARTISGTLSTLEIFKAEVEP